MASVAEQAIRNRMNAQAAMYGNVSVGTAAGGSRTAGNGRAVGGKRRVSNETYRTAFVAAVVILLVFTIVGFSAHIAKLQHDNNAIQARISSLEADIDSLENQITEGSNVSHVEQTATRKLGMVYPNSENCINLDAKQLKNENTGLAARIKKEAYK